MTKAKFRTFSILFSTIVHKHKKIMTYCFNINDLLRSFNKITWRRKCYLKHFCWFIIIINGMKLNCKTYSTTDGVQELASQIQDFFSTSLQFEYFWDPEKSKLKFQYFSGPVGILCRIFSTNIRFKKKLFEKQKTLGLYNNMLSWQVHTVMRKNVQELMRNAFWKHKTHHRHARPLYLWRHHRELSFALRPRFICNMRTKKKPLVFFTCRLHSDSKPRGVQMTKVSIRHQLTSPLFR